MIKKALAFVACILSAFTAVAQSLTHVVTQGENAGTISTRFHEKLSKLRAASPNANLSKSRIGVVLMLSSKPGLTIPVAASQSGKPTTATAPTYRFVKAGAHDNDYTIAKRFDTSAKSIRLLNPSITWSKLRPGSKIKVPTHSAYAVSGSAAQAILVSTSKSKSHKATPAPQPKEIASQVYKTSGDDNDWIIARKFGMTPPMIRAANPGVNWNKLGPGKKIVIPAVKGTAAVAILKKRKGITTHYAILRGDNVNVRSGARTNADSILQVDGGTPVVIIDRMDNWYKLKFPHGTKGWVRGDLLEASARRPKAFLAYQRQNDEPVYQSSRRRRNDDDDDEQPTVSRRHQAAMRIASRSHQSHRYSTPAPHRNRESDSMAYTSEGGDGVISAARSMLGVRYRYGAESRSATDCSGFTQQTYRREGVRLPRTAREQYGVGRSVPRGDLKPGDLVFFHTTRSGVSHVGIYKGNNEFIHASSGKGHVTISKLEGYYSRRFVGARRVRSVSSSKKSRKSKIKFSVD